MPRKSKVDEQSEIAEAQYLVCSSLVRACQQAIYDLAVDEEREPAVRHRAIAALKDILADWTTARQQLRREMRMTSPRAATFTAR